MTDFVDDATDLPGDKLDATPVKAGEEAQHIAAADFNEVKQAVADLRNHSLKSGPTVSGQPTATPYVDHTSLFISGSAADSRDAPVNGVIFRNTGLANNPRTLIGNPYVAGIGKNAWGVWYTDDTLSGVWQIILSGEQTGTFAPVLDGVRRSAVEVFLQNGDFKPLMRLEASSQGMNWGPGGGVSLAGDTSRTSNVVTVITQAEHKLEAGDPLWKSTGPGSNASDLTLFGADSVTVATLTVASVVNAHTFTYSDSGSNGTSAGAIYYSAETDTTFGRDGRRLAAVRVNGSTVMQFAESGPVVPGGLSLLASRSVLPIGAQGAAAVEVSASMFHVLEGKTFYQQGTYQSTGWYNDGNQTQTTQEVFKAAGGGAPRNTKIAAAGADWVVKRTFNYSNDDLTISSENGTDTFNDGGTSIVIPGWSGVTLVSQGTDWMVFYSPPLP